MAIITGKKTVFFVTSPRTPNKLIDEVGFLAKYFSAQEWNDNTQKKYYLALSKQPFFEGTASGDIAFKARDRINRAPKSLGLVDLKPTIRLSEAGKQYIFGKRPEEAFVRQLLKFQLPSPYHIDDNNIFNVKPYLELIRFVYELKGLSKIEIALFVVQLTDFKDYSKIKTKIEAFRMEANLRKSKQVSYKKFVSDAFARELLALYKNEIKENNISTRESSEVSLDRFISTKKSNHLDYADAAIRYLRATGLFSINPRTFKIYVMPDKNKDVEYILKNTPREASSYKDEATFKKHLFNPSIPLLLTDNKEALIAKLTLKTPSLKRKLLQAKNIEALKDLYNDMVIKKLDSFIKTEQDKLKTYLEYDDIVNTFEEIEKKEIVDPPLFLEWNVWRAFSMLDDGNIIGNFRVDDNGIPLYTAPGNTPDIICQYKNFEITVEVTLSSGHKQYEMEGEPVARHLGNHKQTTKKDVYCIFIAPKVSEATLAHFYSLYRTNVRYYGGKAKIIPLSLNDFRNLLSNANSLKSKPTSESIRLFFKNLSDSAIQSKDEVEWYNDISEHAKNAFLKTK